jgi:autoinducer 2 (AI-2) kinase
MTDSLYLVLDAGTGGGRAVVFDSRGRLLRRAYRAWSYRTPPGMEPYGKEFEAGEFWSLLGQACREALSGLNPARLRAVSSTAMRLGYVFLDKEGRELYAGPNRDARGLEVGLELEEKIGEEFTTTRTGHWPPWIFAPGRLLWFRLNAAEIFSRLAHVLMINDWILYRLSGELAVELSAAGDSCLLDIRSRQWSAELVQALELELSQFPPLVTSGTPIGRVSERAAAETGIPAGTPVVAGGADSQCALLAAGVIEPRQVGVIAGTTAPVMAVCGDPRLGPAAKVWTNCHLLPQRWVLESNSGDAGKILRWYVEGHASGDYADLLAQAAATPPGSNLVLASLGPMVFNLKDINPGRRAGFIFPFPVEPEQVSPGAVTRSILENVAYALRGNLDQLLPALGWEPEKISLTGGMARSRLFAEIAAAALARPLELVDCPEASALGAAMAAAAGAGAHPDLAAAAQAMAPARSEIAPNPAWVAEYEDLRGDWLEQVKKFENPFEE